MGFRQGSFAKVWKYEDKGNYGVGQVSISKKNKESGQYEVDFQDGFVRFIGNAHELMKDATIPDRGGLTIKIGSCDVTKRYLKEKEQTYINYLMFDFEFPDGNGGGSKKKAEKAPEPPSEADSYDALDEDLPF